MRKNGYILLCEATGHKTYWPEFEAWKERQKSFTSEFWEEYRTVHKPAKDDVYHMVRKHFQSVSKYDRKSLNSPTQGTGAIIMKDSQIDLFWWVVENGYFGKCLLANLTHDEANWEYPEELEIFPKVLVEKMEAAGDKYCKAVPIPADAAIGDHWIH